MEVSSEQDRVKPCSVRDERSTLHHPGCRLYPSSIIQVSDIVDVSFGERLATSSMLIDAEPTCEK
jgi:hypothetical protein